MTIFEITMTRLTIPQSASGDDIALAGGGIQTPKAHHREYGK